MRDRAAELLDEEAALAGTLAQTWGADGEEFPRLHLPFERLLAHTDAAVLTVTAAPEGPGTEVVAAAGWDPVVGDGERLMGQLRSLRAEGYRIVVCAEGRGSGARLAGLARRPRLWPPRSTRRRPPPPSSPTRASGSCSSRSSAASCTRL